MLREPPQPGRHAHLSAASGLVRVGPWLYVIADDENQLGVFPLTLSEPGTLLPLRDGLLPDEKGRRKALKPDLEALLRIPENSELPYGALLALGSGSRPQRNTGFLLIIGADGRFLDQPRAIDLTTLYTSITQALGVPLNIEGGVLREGRMRLLQRGNNNDRRSAIVDVDVSNQTWLAESWPAQPILSVRWFDLGDIDGVALSFSDAVLLADGSLLFAAIAEDTKDNYADGRCVGAAVGVIDPHDVLTKLQMLSLPLKIEGVELAAPQSGSIIELLLVTDADDPEVPATLYSARLTR
jgi:hypothetical protein